MVTPTTAVQWRQAVTECGGRVLWCIPCGSQLRRHWPAPSHHLWLRLCRKEVADGDSSHRLPKRRRAWSQPWAAVTVRRAASGGALPPCGRLPPGSCAPRRLHHALPAPAPALCSRLRLRAPGTHLAGSLRLGFRLRSTLRQRFIGYAARPHR